MSYRSITTPRPTPFDLDAFKRIYITPMKSLIQEMVGNFSERFKIFSVKVGELTDDVQMTKQQIAEIIVTPLDTSIPTPVIPIS
jgi:replicative superfamily II helicase